MENLYNDEILTTLYDKLSISNKTIHYTELAIFASLLSYFVIKVQRNDLQEYIENPNKNPTIKDYFKIDFIVGVIVVICACYYFNISKASLNATKTVDNVNLCSNKINYISTFMVLISALIRLYDVLFLKRNNTNIPVESETQIIEPDLI